MVYGFPSQNGGYKPWVPAVQPLPAAQAMAAVSLALTEDPAGALLLTQEVSQAAALALMGTFQPEGGFGLNQQRLFLLNLLGLPNEFKQLQQALEQWLVETTPALSAQNAAKNATGAGETLPVALLAQLLQEKTTEVRPVLLQMLQQAVQTEWLKAAGPSPESMNKAALEQSLERLMSLSPREGLNQQNALNMLMQLYLPTLNPPPKAPFAQLGTEWSSPQGQDQSPALTLYIQTLHFGRFSFRLSQPQPVEFELVATCESEGQAVQQPLEKALTDWKPAAYTLIWLWQQTPQALSPPESASQTPASQPVLPQGAPVSLSLLGLAHQLLQSLLALDEAEGLRLNRLNKVE